MQRSDVQAVAPHRRIEGTKLSGGSYLLDMCTVRRQRRRSERTEWLSLGLSLLILAGCFEGDPAVSVFVPKTPHEKYEFAVRQMGLERTALGHEWILASREALTRALPIATPYQELGYFDPKESHAIGYRLEVDRGQRLEVEVEVVGDAPAQVFIDLFREVSDTIRPTRHVANADSNSYRFGYIVPRTASYVLRLQPEMLRGGRYRVTIVTGASLSFPVLGVDTRAIRSGFGASRDGGRRRHRGVDIFAPRGTPVLAAVDGIVTSTRPNRLGGRVVWLSDLRGQRLYYAHLDSVVVRRRQGVSVGDTLGFVGNTGNARTTPPHLHFMVRFGTAGVVDPYPFLYEPPQVPQTLAADTELIGGWVRAARDSIYVQRSPVAIASVVRTVARHTPMRILGGTGQWYRVSLPDGGTGFVAVDMIEPSLRPLRSVQLADGGLIFARPEHSASVMDSLVAGAELPVLGEFRDFLYVQTPEGRVGWMTLD